MTGFKSIPQELLKAFILLKVKAKALQLFYLQIKKINLYFL